MIRQFRWTTLVPVLFLTMFFSAPLGAAGTPGQSSVSSSELDISPAIEGGAAPKIFAPVTRFVFDKVVDGVPVVHDYIVKNTGNAELEIEKVQAG